MWMCGKRAVTVSDKTRNCLGHSSSVMASYFLCPQVWPLAFQRGAKGKRWYIITYMYSIPWFDLTERLVACSAMRSWLTFVEVCWLSCLLTVTPFLSTAFLCRWKNSCKRQTESENIRTFISDYLHSPSEGQQHFTDKSYMSGLGMLILRWQYRQLSRLSRLKCDI